MLTAGLGVHATALLLTRRLTTSGIDPTVAAEIVKLAGRPARPPGRVPAHGQAGAVQRKLEATLRAAFLVNAARRLEQAYKAGDFKHGLQLERSWLAAHIDAARLRSVAAERVDATAVALGYHAGTGPVQLLGWHLGVTGKHTTACLAAAGHNFDPAIRPRIGYPGTVHPRCGCWPGPPYPGATTVDTATSRLPADAD